MVCCPCCGPKRVLSSFSFKFHSFTHRVHVFIGAYSKCNQDERGGIRMFYSYLHLLSKGTSNQIIPQCKLHASALMLMSRTSKTLITDRGPTFGDGIFPKQVMLSVAFMYLYLCVYIYICISIFIYYIYLCVYINIYVYCIYIYIYMVNPPSMDSLQAKFAPT